jgi:hypothetical protein
MMATTGAEEASFRFFKPSSCGTESEGHDPGEVGW